MTGRPLSSTLLCPEKSTYTWRYKQADARMCIDIRIFVIVCAMTTKFWEDTQTTDIRNKHHTYIEMASFLYRAMQQHKLVHRLPRYKIKLNRAMITIAILGPWFAMLRWLALTANAANTPVPSNHQSIKKTCIITSRATGWSWSVIHATSVSRITISENNIDTPPNT